MNQPMKDGRRYERLAALANEHGSGEVPAAVHATGRDRLIAELVDRKPPSRVKRVVTTGGFATLAAAAAIAAAVGVASLRAPMKWQVDGAAQVAGDYVRADSADATVRFENGARCELASGSRGRVSTGKHSASIVLERGHARLKAPHATMSWLLQAGPYALTGDGGFDVAWSDEALDVRVKDGAVVVRGPQAPDGVALHADQHLVARGGELHVDSTSADVAPAPVPSPPPTPTSAPSPEVTSDPTPAPTPSSTITTRAPSWSQRVSKGDYAGVLADANDRGVPSVLHSATLSDLVALADAARYARRTDIAKQALLAQRSRFAGSGPARAAAFLLGRLAEDSEGNAGAAIGWYDRYLTESPSGSFAAEALGRKMTAVSRTQGTDAAKPIAESYLRRYPDGPYAGAARRLAGN